MQSLLVKTDENCSKVVVYNDGRYDLGDGKGIISVRLVSQLKILQEKFFVARMWRKTLWMTVFLLQQGATP